MKLEESKTKINLEKAFTNESRVHTKYMLYASKAKKEGYEQIAAIFEDIAHNEKEHAKIWLKELLGGELNSTLDNLLDSAKNEKEEWALVYSDMAKTANEEGFEELGKLFENIGSIEKSHEELLSNLYDTLRDGKVFKKNGIVMWKCRNCGHIHIAKVAPKQCPVCSHPQAFFELDIENYCSAGK